MKIKQFAILIVVLITSYTDLYSQTGTIKGTVWDKKLNEALVGVNVYIQGSSTGSATDLNGNYTINNVKPGTYNLVASYISYKTQIIEKVIVKPQQTTIVNITLEEDAIVIKDIVISAVRVSQSEVNVINAIKNSDNVVSGVSGQTISKTMDRDASEVLKRVPGITIMNGRFIMIRGLSERFNSVWLNGAATPSSEVDVKAFSFDLIPSGMIDNILVFKTPSAELPSDFAGGSIQVFTRNVPESNNISVSFSQSYRTNTTFKRFVRHEGGKYDWLGFDDGTRGLPDNFPSAEDFIKMSNSSNITEREKVLEVSKNLNKNWTTHTITAIPDQRFSFGFSRRFNIKKSTLGNITSLNYTNTFTNHEIYRADYQNYDTVLDKSVLYYYNNDTQFTNNIKLGFLHNWSIVIGEGLNIDFRNLFNQISYTRTILRNGYENYGGNYIMANEFRFLSRTIYSGQLAGRYKFRNQLTEFNWVAGYSFSNRNEPDIKRLSFNKITEDPSDPHYEKYALQFFFAASPEKVGRVFIRLKENVYVGSFNLKHNLVFSETFNAELKTGFYLESKDRTFSTRNIGYKVSNLFYFNQELPFLPIEEIFNNKNINDSDGIVLDEKTNASDSYTAKNKLIAGYLNIKIPLREKLNINAGVRIERNIQELHSFRTDNPTIPVNVMLDSINIYPSVNLSYNLNHNRLFRIAYGMTVNRPEFREIAPYLFYDFENKAGIRGNPMIVNTYIHNYDFRYEIYPSPKEMISAGIFYKNFINPIEVYVVPSGSGAEYTFRNTKSAYSYGIELDIKKSLETLSKRSDWLSGFKDFSVIFNGSLIKSMIKFAENELESDRAMQGQSPYILNTGIFYQNDSFNFNVSILYNIIGKRIIYAGDPYSQAPDVYEMPHHNLDLIISKKLGKNLQVKLGVQDLLNQEIVYKQTIHFNKDNNGDGKGDGIVSRDEIRLNYFPGRYFTLSLDLKL